VNDDLKRRDFTINQLRMDAELNVLDAFNGRSDLNQKIIRTIHNPDDRFKEDALRMIRAFRFSAKLGFRIEEETLNSIQANASLIQKISIERIQDEFKKMLDYEVLKPTIKLMIDTGFAKACFDLDQGLKYLLNVGELNPFERIYRVSLGVDFKKAPWKSPLKTLKKIADYNDLIKAFDTLHPRLFLNYPKALIFEVVDYLNKTSSMNKIKELETLYEGLIIKDKKDLKINGKTIDEVLKPKDKSLIKTILNELYDKVLEGSLKNTKDALIQEVKTRKQGL
jgi:tRNA nucleotidyltransferase (CCA-adding enzyme)